MVVISLSFRRAFNVALFSIVVAMAKRATGVMGSNLYGKRNMALDGGEKVFSKCLS